MAEAADRQVVVTGAAGGIGRATVRAFLDAGYAVAGVDLVEQVRDAPGAGEYVGLVADTRDHRALVEALARLRRPIAHLVTCAGISLPEEMGDAGRALPDVDVFRATVELNLTSHYATLAAAWPAMRGGAGDRSVSFASSVNALQGFGIIGYSAAKAGLLGMVRSLVVPLGRAGVRVNAVAPGTVPTPNTLREWAGAPEHFEEMARLVPTGRLGVPEDIAAAFLALARDLTHVSGQVLVVDGGQSIGR